MTFKNFEKSDYDSVCDFLTELSRADESHINWNWARFEWMYEHPEFDKAAQSSIGLWFDGERIVGAAIYDMYFGEAFCGVLPEYKALYPEVLEYAYKELGDDSGLAVSVSEDNSNDIAELSGAGFERIDQTETIMSITTDRAFDSGLPDGFSLYELDPAKEPYDYQWILWRGFDHGEEKEEFEREDKIVPQLRPHLDPSLSLAAVDGGGEIAVYSCLWYKNDTDYAYVEPVCTAPSYRGKGLAKALIYEALNRAAALGANKAYVISDTDFYKKLGFDFCRRFVFYHKP